MFENKNKIFALAGIGIILVSIVFYLKHSNRSQDGNQFSSRESNTVLVENGVVTERVQLATGKIEPASILEQDNFSSFKGFPKLVDDKGKNGEQIDALVSQDLTQAIVTIATYNSAIPATSDGFYSVIDTTDYVCDISQKSCQQSDIFSGSYTGLEPDLQKKDSPLMWFKWDSARNLIFGHIVKDNLGDASPVYICDTQKMVCNKTEGYDSMKEGEVRAVVPTGSFSPLLDKFVMINQHDVLNLETGKTWELLVYSSNDLSKVEKSYDISEAISEDNGGYDSVYSVAWSGDGKRLAIATSSKIFMLDFKSGKLALIYTDPVTEENSLNMDSSALFFSEDGRYLAFVSSVDLQDEETDESVNVLKRIDLKKDNAVKDLLSDDGLSLKLR